MNTALIELASRFQMLQLQVTLQLQQSTVLPSFKGSMWHGWLGHLIKRTDEHVFHVCFGNHDERQPKPYWIDPGIDHKTQWQQGELIQFTVNLAGSSIELAPPIIKALQHPLGLGPKRAAVSLVSVASITPEGLVTGLTPTSLAAWLHPHSCLSINTEFALHLVTPTRIKQKQILKLPPPLPVWVNSILRRLTQLARFWVCDDQALMDAIYVQPHHIGNYQQQNHCYFEDWHRYSHKQRELTPFGGIKGQVSFYGEIANVKAILQVGQQLQVGSKTTFGLGKYQLIG